MARRRAASESRSNSDDAAFDPFSSDRRLNKYTVDRKSSTDSEMFQKLQRRRRIAEGEEEPSSYQSPRHNKTDLLKHVGMSPEMKARLQARLNIPSDDSNIYKSPRSTKQSDKGRFKHVPLNSEVESKLLVQLRKSSRADSKKSFMSSDEFDVRSLGSDASFVENYEGGSTIVVDESSTTTEEEDVVDSIHENSASCLDELQDSQRTDENEDESSSDHDDGDDDFSKSQRNDSESVNPSNKTRNDDEFKKSYQIHSGHVDDRSQEDDSDNEDSNNHDVSESSSHRSNRSDDEYSHIDRSDDDDHSNDSGEHSDSRSDDDRDNSNPTQEKDDEQLTHHLDADEEENDNRDTFDENCSVTSGDASTAGAGSVHDQFSRNMQREESGFSSESERSQEESQYSREANNTRGHHSRGVHRSESGFSAQSENSQESNFSTGSDDNRPMFQRGESKFSTESNDSRESQYSREEEEEDESGHSHSQSRSESHSHESGNVSPDEEYDDGKSYEASKCEDSFFATQIYSDMASLGTTGVDRIESFFSHAQTAVSAGEEEPIQEIIEESEESGSMVGEENSHYCAASEHTLTKETGQDLFFGTEGSDSSMVEAAFEANFSMVDDHFKEQNGTMYPTEDNILGGSVVFEDQKEGLESIAEEDEEEDDELKPRTCREAESDFFGRLMRGSRLRKQESYSEESMQIEAIGAILDSVPEEQSKELSSRLFSESIHESSRSAFKSIASLEPEGIDCDEEMQMVESIRSESEADEVEEAETNSREVESEKSKRKKGDCCSLWFWIIISVTLVSVCTGLGIGLFFLGGSHSENEESNLSGNGTVPEKETDTSTPRVPTDPVLTNLSPEQLNVYNLLCPKLEDCTSLLNMFTPQGQAFDWLTNDKTANPDLNEMSDDTKTQRFALAALFYATNGNYWTNKTNWISSESECKWYSSAASPCDDNGRLIALELDSNQVQGLLPFEISLLTSLTTLSMQNPGNSSTFLSGSVPRFLGSAISLRSINLSGNQFSGVIPSELGSLVNLEYLDLSNNALSGEIPPSFALLRKMTAFDVAGNKLTSINALFFEGKLTLSELNLSRNRLEDLPPSTGRLLSLRTLNLAQNSFSTFPLEVTELLFLSSLDLSGNSITGQIPGHLGRMNALRNLNLSKNKLVGNIPAEIGNLVDMTESLNLSSNGLQGSIPSALGNLVSLQRLLLNGNQLGGSIPAELASLTQILEIRLDDNIFTGQVPVALCQLYNKTEPMAFADCAELTLAECFNYCCKDVTGCTCRWESTDPFRCLA